MTDSVLQTPLTTCRAHRPLNSVVKNGTPFRTPDVRRFGPVGSARPVRRREAQSEARESNIKELLKKTWHVFRLTPLYNLETKQSDLHTYSRSLSSYLAAETQKGKFVDTSLPGEATVGMVSGFDVSPDDPRALLLEIKGKARNKQASTVISQALLFSTDLEYSPLEPSLKDSFVYYPAMLIRGTAALSQLVQNWLEVQFDCRVVPMTFRSHELVFMMAMFTGFSEEHKPLELVYSVPVEVEGLSTISYATQADDCFRLWNRIRSTEEETFTSEEAKLFIAGLESHFYECFNIKLSSLPLSTIGTSVAFVGEDGKIKFYTKSAENTLRVLRHLTDLALDQLIETKGL